MIRIAVCEDELEQVEIITGYLEALKPRYPDIVWNVFRSGDDLLEHYRRMPIDGHYDIVFFDVQMPGTDGVETASIIRGLDKKVLFIYITNFKDFVLEAANTYMFRYLIKPVAWGKFLSVFVDACKTLNVARHTFTYTKEYVDTRLYTDDIIYFERLGRKINIHTVEGIDSIWHQIAKLHEELSPYGFVMTHKSFLVNMAYIYKVSRKFIVLNDQTTQIPIGNTHVQDVRKAFMGYEFGRVNV
jgi:DNA-binding LytR/AlgR family response regulator